MYAAAPPPSCADAACAPPTRSTASDGGCNATTRTSPKRSGADMSNWLVDLGVPGERILSAWIATEELRACSRWQRQRVTSAAVVDHAGHEARREGQPCLFSGPFDDLVQRVPAECADEGRLTHQIGETGLQEAGEKVRAHGGHHPQPSVIAQSVADGGQERLPF